MDDDMRQTVLFDGVEYEIPPGMTRGEEVAHTLNQLQAGESRVRTFYQRPGTEVVLRAGERYMLTAAGLLFNEYGSYLGTLQ